MIDIGFKESVKRELRVLGSRRVYLAMMVVLPVLLCLFFTGLLAPGLPLKVPTAVVDLDRSSMSRQVVRSLRSVELLDAARSCDSYDEAMRLMRCGDIYGFVVIPADFEKETVTGKSPTLEYYNNLTYFVPGTLAFKGFTTVAVGTAGNVVKSKLAAQGVSKITIAGLSQPISVQTLQIGNPWSSYAIYLCPSFIFGSLALLIMLMTVFGITSEIKHGTSREWLAAARGHIGVAVMAKALPHFVIWSVIGQFALALMFCYNGFPCANLPLMVVAVEMFVIASQALGVLFACIMPNPRMALTMASFLGILSFSFAGFSFPVSQMYGAVGVFSYIVPVRHLFLTYIITGLDGFPLYYARVHMAVLALFPILAGAMLWRLKKACLKPVYVP